MSDGLTPAQLDEIEAAAKKATPGEWRVDGEQIEAGEFGEVIVPGPVLCGSYCYGGSSTIDGDHLAEDFAHVAMMDPATTLALIAEVRELRAKVERVREVHEPIDALLNPGRHERVVKVCIGCGTDDGNWQRYPCPTTRALGEGA